MPPPNKRRKTESKVEEINFDTFARQEFLTGFHKRKLQRAKHAQDAAERRAREEKIAERKRIRDERKADLERHIQEMNALMRPADGESEEDEEESETDDGAEGKWEGIEDGDPPPIDHEAEYIDEDRYTTVTVEAVDVSREGLSKLGEDSDESMDERNLQANGIPENKHKKTTKIKSLADKQRNLQSKINKRKRKNFRYESKTDRKASRMKEKLKNSKQARARKAG